jgi:hypothetical protein
MNEQTKGPRMGAAFDTADAARQAIAERIADLRSMGYPVEIESSTEILVAGEVAEVRTWATLSTADGELRMVIARGVRHGTLH